MPSIVDIGKAFLEVSASIQSVDDKARLLDLMSQMQEMGLEMDRMRDENSNLRKQLASRKKLERIGGAYYVLEDDGSKTGPVCPQCYVRDELVCILERSPSGAHCARCGSRYPGVDASVECCRQKVF